MSLARPLIAIVLVAGVPAQARSSDWKELRGPYLGQKPPGAVPEIFAPGIVSTDDVNHCSVAVSPDGREIYWAMGPLDHPKRIYVSTQADIGWSEPEVLSFTEDQDGDCPVLSPDGQKLYFNSNRPSSPGAGRRERYWVAERAGDGWSEPRPLGPAVNEDHLHWQASVDRQGRFYFGSEREGTKGRDDIFVVSLDDGEESRAVSLDGPINTELLEGNPYVAPDGSYLIFDREGLFISSRSGDGSWGTPRSLGIEGTCPHVSPDGKYLFFLKMGMGYNDVYWVDARVLSVK
jgi:Tol biopolymer transport system component